MAEAYHWAELSSGMIGTESRYPTYGQIYMAKSFRHMSFKLLR